MATLSKEDFIKKVEATPVEQPDEWDLAMLAEIDADNDHSTVTLEQVIARHECSGKISVRVPKELHYALLKSAKDNGVSLNQYIVNKLAKA